MLLFFLSTTILFFHYFQKPFQRSEENFLIANVTDANYELALKEMESSETDLSNLKGSPTQNKATHSSKSVTKDLHDSKIMGNQEVTNKFSPQDKVKYQPLNKQDKSSAKEISEQIAPGFPKYNSTKFSSKPGRKVDQNTKSRVIQKMTSNLSLKAENATRKQFNLSRKLMDSQSPANKKGSKDEALFRLNQIEAEKWKQKVLGLIQQARPDPEQKQEAKSVDVSQKKESFMLKRSPVALVLSTVRVEFSLLTKGDHQFAAFYSPSRAMTVAQRTLGNATWKFKELSSKIGWDNHNWIVLGLDETGCLHVSGNMHASPLVYYRASKPLDIDSLEIEKTMVGDGSWQFMENQVTYPVFLNTPNGELVYYYRHGMSMSGGTLINIYNASARAWRRIYGGDGLLITGMATGRPRARESIDMNPYNSLRRGPDGRYHLIWLWRDTPDASTCHHLCYARSRDLRLWETADGRPLATPIVFNYTEQVHFLAMPVVLSIPFLPQACRRGIS